MFAWANQLLSQSTIANNNDKPLIRKQTTRKYKWITYLKYLHPSFSSQALKQVWELLTNNLIPIKFPLSIGHCWVAPSHWLIFFLLAFCKKKSLICPEGESMSPSMGKVLASFVASSLVLVTRTLEGLFELTRHPSRALNLASCVDSRNRRTLLGVQQTWAIPLFYPNTQYFQRGLSNTQYQFQFFEEALTIPNTNIHEGY